MVCALGEITTWVVEASEVIFGQIATIYIPNFEDWFSISLPVSWGARIRKIGKVLLSLTIRRWKGIDEYRFENHSSSLLWYELKERKKKSAYSLPAKGNLELWESPSFWKTWIVVMNAIDPRPMPKAFSIPLFFSFHFPILLFFISFHSLVWKILSSKAIKDPFFFLGAALCYSFFCYLIFNLAIFVVRFLLLQKVRAKNK